MPDRRKLVVHLRKLHTLVENAIKQGPDGEWDPILRPGLKKPDWAPEFIHYANALYLIGVLAYLEGEGDEYSWNERGRSDFDSFDSFANAEGTKVTVEDTRGRAIFEWRTFAQQEITKANLDALVQVRNAVAHNDGDLNQNRNPNPLAMVTAADFPGVKFTTGSIITLEDESFCRYVRKAALAVRRYYNDY